MIHRTNQNKEQQNRRQAFPFIVLVNSSPASVTSPEGRPTAPLAAMINSDNSRSQFYSSNDIVNHHSSDNSNNAPPGRHESRGN